eukprot:3567348-Pleurochrysis_carterae.AAC.5
MDAAQPHAERVVLRRRQVAHHHGVLLPAWHRRDAAHFDCARGLCTDDAVVRMQVEHRELPLPLARSAARGGVCGGGGSLWRVLLVLAQHHDEVDVDGARVDNIEGEARQRRRRALAAGADFAKVELSRAAGAAAVSCTAAAAAGLWDRTRDFVLQTLERPATAVALLLVVVVPLVAEVVVDVAAAEAEEVGAEVGEGFAVAASVSFAEATASVTAATAAAAGSAADARMGEAVT